MIRFSCRMKLSDFIETDIEVDIIELAKFISDSLESTIFIKLWYEKMEIEPRQISDFIKRHELTLEAIGTNIHAGGFEEWMNKSWFDIRPRTQMIYTNYRYYYLYDHPTEIPTGLFLFKNMVEKSINIKSISNNNYSKSTSNRPPKKRGGTHRVSYKRIPK